MPKFLILQSPNKGNVGTITNRDDENFYKPTFYKITDEEIEIYSAMNAHAKAAYLAEKLEAQIGTPTQVKKKVAPIVEIVESQAENVLDKMPEEEEEEPLNEPINELTEKQIELYEKFDKHEKDSQVKALVSAVEKPKAKGRPKKVK